MHLPKIDFEPCNRKTSVGAALPMDTSRDLAQKDFFWSETRMWKEAPFLSLPSRRRRDQSSNESNPSPVITSSTFADSAVVKMSTSSRPRVCFVPVKASGPGGDKQLTTYFLDSGSLTSLCLDSLVQELGLENEPADFTL